MTCPLKTYSAKCTLWLHFPKLSYSIQCRLTASSISGISIWGMSQFHEKILSEYRWVESGGRHLVSGAEPCHCTCSTYRHAVIEWQAAASGRIFHFCTNRNYRNLLVEPSSFDKRAGEIRPFLLIRPRLLYQVENWTFCLDCLRVCLKQA